MDRDALTPREEPRDIERAIDVSRRRIASTMHEIEHRLSPSNLRTKAREATVGKVEHMARNVRESTMESGRTMAETVRSNPIPAAMIGLGLAWLLMNRPRRERPLVARRLEYGYGPPERIIHNGEARRGDGQRGTIARAAEAGREKVEELKEGVQEAAERAREGAREMTAQAREQTQRAAKEVREQANRVEDYFDRAMEANPLAVGAIVLGIGLAIGIALPRTEKETELFGPARDRLIERAKSRALDVAEKGEEKLGEAAERVVGSPPSGGA
jgi:ElaB/YqjD/DUF883 family membrane-anchored ribosome-binding protein